MKTYADSYGPAMEITDQKEADVYFERLVSDRLGQRNKHVGALGRMSREEAEKIERGNLGYYAGYHGNETRERVERLFKCEHPIFGSIAQRGAPTAEEAFIIGVVAAKNGSEEAARRFKERTLPKLEEVL